MCKWFKKKTIPLSIPYPEEKPDYSKQVVNTSISSVINEWMVKYNVPEEHRVWWRTQIECHIYDKWTPDILTKWPSIAKDPAFSVEENGTRHLYCLAPFFNPGVVAHEQAHNSWFLLTDAQRKGFSAIYTPLKATDPLIKLLYSQNSYGTTSDIEGHAELYRYLNEKMPERLKFYYPKLIRG